MEKIDDYVEILKLKQQFFREVASSNNDAALCVLHQTPDCEADMFSCGDDYPYEQAKRPVAEHFCQHCLSSGHFVLCRSDHSKSSSTGFKTPLYAEYGSLCTKRFSTRQTKAFSSSLPTCLKIFRAVLQRYLIRDIQHLICHLKTF